MSASTGPREAQRKPGDVQSYLMGAVKINKGVQVVIRSDGYLYPLRAPASSQADVFAGISYETVDNSAGSAGAAGMRVNKTGSYVLNKASAAQTDVGLAFYGVDDQTVSTTSTNAVLTGYCTEYISTTQLRIRIDRAVQ